MNALVDRWGRVHTYLRVSVTDRCNLRCVYCMPPEGIPWRERSEILTLEEVLRAARCFVSLGIRKIRLTGGEPTARKDIEWLIERLAALNGLETLAMTTNGVVLRDRATALKSAGLHALNISLDTLRRERFARITHRDRFDDVMAGIEAALAAGFAPLKINTVIMAGINDDEILDFVAFARDKPIRLRFIEYMPFRGNGWNPGGFVSCRRMMEIIEARHLLLPAEQTAGAVAREYHIPGSQGTVGFITPLSNEFCRSCSRVRLTADGSVKSCLFFTAEANLRDALRAGASDEVLADTIRVALQRKPEGHPPAERMVGAGALTMTEIGG